MDKIHENGKVTFTAGGAIAKGEFVKFDSGKVVPCTAKTDAAIGVALDAAADGEILPVAVLGAFCGTAPVKATAAIVQGAAITCAGATVVAGDKVCGLALEAATASGDLIECALCVPALNAVAA